MRILVLGGTRFLGRAITEAALGRGDAVTLFNRGKTDPGLYPGIKTVVGDRATDLARIESREWDAVIDVAGDDPEVVRISAEAFAKTASRYVFVSTVSVYADQSSREGQLEDAPVLEQHDGMTDPGELYGARKAAAERIVANVYGERALIPRPGLITGPHDPTDRVPYWPRRIARGGHVLAPGDPDDLTQFIDVRDLAVLDRRRLPPRAQRNLQPDGRSRSVRTIPARLQGGDVQRRGADLDPVQPPARGGRQPVDGHPDVDRRPRPARHQ